MGQAKTLDVRLRVIQMKQSKQTNSQISAVLGIGIGSVKNYWKRYLTDGEFGLSLRYSHCGRLVSLSKEKSYRLVRLVKHLHPGWGLPVRLVDTHRHPVHGDAGGGDHGVQPRAPV